ncbi:AAA family ATPase [Nonomuraea sp. NN258]|uniref:BTAD domain-containing putative transcriptional regulator n=1 Tax=Nonomuraea antri TaxID=2730852 RepID=UPI0015684037|nr:BTAD domain-containing putative transcriptional regulator [Nonomuraea antri]NRQ35014.1 AAA family ATPase [Nonomuraea antri]
MRFGILGTTRAWRPDGAEVPLGGPARRSLLALLLLRPGEVVTHERLIDVLYGDRPPADARHALHSQVSRLRSAGIAIERAAAGYLLPVDPGDVDAHRFLRLAESGRQALDGGDAERAATLLRAALALWRGPALADLDDAHAVSLEDRRLAALEDRLEADLRRGAHRAVIPELTSLIDAHPLRERLRGQLMRALRAEGRQAEALVLFEETRRLLADELGADPSKELADLHRSLLRSEPEPPAGGRGGPAGDAPSAPLPGRLTSFVGRERDVAEVRALLGSARLVTLLGPGGVGKTRLAVEVAAEAPAAEATAKAPTAEVAEEVAEEVAGEAAAAHRPAEVALVELAPVTGDTELLQAVLGALGIRESGLLTGPSAAPIPDPGPTNGPTDGPPAALPARLVGALADRPFLLVLDNCEHVVQEAATLAERLLSACPGLRILATSREPLGITPEHLWPVRPLAPAEAVRLFSERARAVRPDFAPGEAVERICGVLDGLPLAIELAAARMRTHEAGELAERLADQDLFRLLSRGSRTADARHRTLRAVVAWSWDLLTERERTMAARLSVFSGGATPAAAARVCGLPDAEDLLDSLADKSLLDVADGRYRMLETIRSFCAERLGDETPALRQAHAAYFLEFAERADPHLRGAGQLGWLERLSADHDNLRAALRRAVDSGDVPLGMRLLAAQSSYLWMRGMRGTYAEAARALLDAAGDDPDVALGDAYILCLLATAGVGAERPEWRRRAAVARRMIRKGPPERRHPLVAYLWPLIVAGTQDPELTMYVIKRSLRSAEPWEHAMGRLIWAYPQMAAGEPARAEADLSAALDAFRTLGDRWGAALALDGLAWLAGSRGDTATALARTEEALALAERLGAAEDLADLLCNRGDYRVRTDPAGARADYERAAELGRRTGLPMYVATALRGLGDVALAAGDLARARELYERALRDTDLGWVRSSGSVTRLLVGLGRLELAEGDVAAAESAFGQAVEVAVMAGALAESAKAIEALAGIAAETGDWSQAAALLGAAVAMRGAEAGAEPEVATVAARTRESLGEQAYARARQGGARLTRREALRLVGVPDTVLDASPLGSIATFAGTLEP